MYVCIYMYSQYVVYVMYAITLSLAARQRRADENLILQIPLTLMGKDIYALEDKIA
jgi:hypothetical protein